MQRQSCLCVSIINQMSVTQHELALVRVHWLDRILEVIHHVLWVVVVLCCPPLRHLLPSTVETTGLVISLQSRYLFDQSIKCKLCLSTDCTCVFACTLSSAYTLVALLHHVYSFMPLPLLSLDSISPGNEGMIQLSLAHCLDQSASLVLSE